MIVSVARAEDEHISCSDGDRVAVTESARANRQNWIAAFNQFPARSWRASVAARHNWRKRFSTLAILSGAALGSAALITVYATLLSRQGVPTSVLVLSAILMASTLSSIAGFAFSAICGAVLLHIMTDPVQVVAVLIVCSIAIQSFSVVLLWRDIDWRQLMTLLVGGVVGLPFGVWLLLHVGGGSFRMVIGGLVAAYAAHGLLRRPATFSSDGNAINVCVGFVGGISGGLAGFPGAAVTIWCGMRGWDKRRQRGIYQPFILIMQVLALLLIQVARSTAMPGTGAGLDLLQFVPVALLGTWFGLVIFRRLSDRLFALAVNLMLLGSGIALLI